MLGIKFILFIILSIITLITIYFIFVRAARNLKRWKAMEPSFIKEVEKKMGQKIIYTSVQNASYSTDFRNGNEFWLWIALFRSACTADYTVMALRDEIIESDKEVNLIIARRKDVTVARLEKYFATIEVRGIKPETLKFTIIVRKDYTTLTSYIRSK